MIDRAGRTLKIGDLVLMLNGYGRGRINNAIYGIAMSTERAYLENGSTLKFNERDFYIITNESDEEKQTHTKITQQYRETLEKKLRKKEQGVIPKPGDLIKTSDYDGYYTLYIGKVAFEANERYKYSAQGVEPVKGEGHLLLLIEPLSRYSTNKKHCEDLAALLKDIKAGKATDINSIVPDIINNVEVTKVLNELRGYTNDRIEAKIFATKPSKVEPEKLVAHNIATFPDEYTLKGGMAGASGNPIKIKIVSK